MHSFGTRLRENWKSGVTVALVNIPLSVSLAVAANATPAMGVITAVWAGLITAFLGGSHYNVVGPTGALSGILAMYAILYGVGMLPVLAILSGILILLFYVFHVERYLIFIPSSVIHGFTLGVALIIALNQMNFALGLQNLPSHGHFIENVIESFRYVGQMQPVALALFLGGILFLFAFLKWSPRFPGPILLAPLGIGLGYAAAKGLLPISLQTLYTRFGEIPAHIVSWHTFSGFKWNMALGIATVSIAVIAVLETLISAKIADGMTHTKFNQRKEVLSLGIANLVSGVMGGIPATAALARTTLNIKSGATHRTSSGISSVVMAIIALLFLPWFKYLPLPIVAAILVYVAVRMVGAEHFVRFYRHDKPAFAISLLVALITVVEDPIYGILVGSTISLLMFVNQLSKGQSEITYNKNKKVVVRLYGDKHHYPDEQDLGEVVVYRFAGQMTYINAQSHLENIRRVAATQSHTVILGMRNLFYMDLDGMDALEEIIDILKESHKRVMVTGAGDFILPLLKKAKWFADKQRRGLVYESTSEALKNLLPTA